MSQITYELLVSLYHGGGTVVERLSEEERLALKVETPLTRLLARVSSGEERRHIILTGSAGDGKSFTLREAQLEGRADLKVISDASGLFDPSLDPIKQLLGEITEALTQGQQLILAINRGQLERLSDEVMKGDDPLRSLLNESLEQLKLKRRWPKPAEGLIAVDLGLQDTLNREIIQATLDRAMNAELSSCSAVVKAAYCEALDALKDPQVSARVMRHFSALRATGVHVTMRQLWSYISYMLTGGRPVKDTAPLSLSDSLAMRMFSGRGEGLLFDLSRSLIDPSAEVRPELVARVFDGELTQAEIAAHPGLRRISEHIDPGLGGVELIYTLSQHSPKRRPIKSPTDELTYYGQLIEQLTVAGGEEVNTASVRQIVRKIYEALELPLDDQLRLWRRLCYDVTLWGSAPLASTHRLNFSRLSLQLPCPSPELRAALEGHWSPPFLWLAYQPEGESSAVKLRLTPSLFTSLFTASGLSDTSRHALWSWLSKVGGEEHSSDLTLWSPQRHERLTLIKPLFGERIEVIRSDERRLS